MARKKNRQTLTKSSSSGSSKGPKRGGRAKTGVSRTRGRGRAVRVGRTMGGGAKRKYAGGKGLKTRKR